MKASEIYGSKYLAAADILGRQVRVQVRLVTCDEMSIDKTKSDKKLVLHFVGCKKAMALNRSNCKQLVEVLGDETDAWPGTWLTLGAAKKDYRGELVDGLVILVIEPVPGPAVAREPGVNGATSDAPGI